MSKQVEANARLMPVNHGKMDDAARQLNNYIRTPEGAAVLALVLAQKDTNRTTLRVKLLCAAQNAAGNPCGQVARNDHMTCPAHKDELVPCAQAKELAAISPYYNARLNQDGEVFATKAALDEHIKETKPVPLKASETQQCKATSASSNKRCKNMTSNADGYCHIKFHRAQCLRPVLADNSPVRVAPAAVAAPRKPMAFKGRVPPAGFRAPPGRPPVNRALFKKRNAPPAAKKFAAAPPKAQAPPPPPVEEEFEDQDDYYYEEEEQVGEGDVGAAAPMDAFYEEEEEEEVPPVPQLPSDLFDDVAEDVQAPFDDTAAVHVRPALCKHMQMKKDGTPNACWMGQCKHKNCQGCVDRQNNIQ